MSVEFWNCNWKTWKLNFDSLNHFFKDKIGDVFQQNKWWSINTQNIQNWLKADLLKAKILSIGKWNMVILWISWDEDLPYLKNEIFKLIEETFETIWASTWTGIKTDKYNDSFSQLVVSKLWENNDVKLLSGYRYFQWPEDRWSISTPISNMFDILKDLILLENHKVLELWTAWSHNTLNKVESILSFSGTWSGLANLTSEYQNEDIFIGKMTIPAQYDKRATIFAIKYLEKVASKNACGVSPNSNIAFDENSFLDLEDFSDVLNDVSSLSWNYEQDRKIIKEILKQDKYVNVGDLPAMFPLYLSRFKQWKFYYTGTVQNANVLESWIVVPMDWINDGVHKTYQSNWNWDCEWMTLWDYIEQQQKTIL